MIKKVVALIISIIIINLILEISCKPEKFHLQITGFNIEVYDRSDRRAIPLKNGDTTFCDTLKLVTDFQCKKIASVHFSSNTLYAYYDPPPDISEGLSDSVSNINLNSNEEFQGISKYGSLNNYVLCKVNIASNNHLISIDSLRTFINSWKGDYLPMCIFYIYKKPNFESLRTFKLVFSFNSGKSIEFETPEFIWL
jgi:hypothetical protein